MILFWVLLFIGLAFLALIFENIYFFIIAFSGYSIFTIYTLIKIIMNRKVSKTKVSSKIDLYCEESRILSEYWYNFIFCASIKYDLNFKYILQNFSKSTFLDQFFFVFNINMVICILCVLTMYIYAKIDSKKGILYKEGFISGEGKLYSFNNLKSYKIKTSFKGRQYRDLVLTYNNKAVKTLYIYKDDIDKFKDLLDKDN